MADTPEETARKIAEKFFTEDEWSQEPLAERIAAALSRVREEALAERTEGAAKICDREETEQRHQAEDFKASDDVEGADECWHAAAMLEIVASRIRALAERQTIAALSCIRAQALEEAAKIADAHKGSAAKERRRKFGRQQRTWSHEALVEIETEERGEDIASEKIAAAIRALAARPAKEGGADE